MIKRNAGQPLYRDYVNLLNVANLVFGHDDLVVGEDAVRKTYQRFMKRNPEIFEFSSEALAVFAVLVLALSILENLNKSVIGNRTL